MKYILICSICFLGFFGTAQASERQTNFQAALAEIMAEPKIKDVIHRERHAIQWHAGVLSDGTPRHGYASYLCQILRDHKVVSTDTWVRVVDIVKVTNGSGFREASLGRVNCDTFEKRSP